jgi:AcrR family transcriptional regulator
MSKRRTRFEIIECALLLARRVGLEAISLGQLAESLAMSKSGLFAHFKSKEALQLEVLQKAVDEFNNFVVLPALANARGTPRLKALLHNYLDWINVKGSCIFMALSQEYDDRPGPIHDMLVSVQKAWMKTISRAVSIAIEEGHFNKDLDPDQFTFSALGIAMAYNHSHKLLADPLAETKARAAFDSLINSCRVKKEDIARS